MATYFQDLLRTNGFNDNALYQNLLKRGDPLQYRIEKAGYGQYNDLIKNQFTLDKQANRKEWDEYNRKQSEFWNKPVQQQNTQPIQSLQQTYDRYTSPDYQPKQYSQDERLSMLSPNLWNSEDRQYYDAMYRQKPKESPYQKLLMDEIDRLRDQRDSVKGVYRKENIPGGTRTFLDNSGVADVQNQITQQLAPLLNTLGQYENTQFGRENLTAKEKAALEAEKQKYAYDNYWKNKELGLKQEADEIDRLKAQSGGKNLTVGQTDTIGNLANSIDSINNIIATYSQPNKTGMFGAEGLTRRSMPWRGLTDPDVKLFEQDVNVLRQMIAKAIEKNRISDKDREFYQKTLFNPNASQQDFVNALKVFRDNETNNLKTQLDVFGRAGYDTSGFQDYGINSQALSKSPSNIPPSAIEHLKQNPNLAGAFEQKYGISASQFL